MIVSCLKLFLVIYVLGLLFGATVLLVWLGAPVLLAGVVSCSPCVWMICKSIKNLLTSRQERRILSI